MEEFLLLLEGEPLNLPAPKNHFISDLEIKSDNDVPIFATVKEKIVFVGKNEQRCAKEDKMMDCRWKFFHFTHEFLEQDQKKIPACGTCFCKLILMGDM